MNKLRSEWEREREKKMANHGHWREIILIRRLSCNPLLASFAGMF